MHTRQCINKLELLKEDKIYILSLYYESDHLESKCELSDLHPTGSNNLLIAVYASFLYSRKSQDIYLLENI